MSDLFTPDGKNSLQKTQEESLRTQVSAALSVDIIKSIARHSRINNEIQDLADILNNSDVFEQMQAFFDQLDQLISHLHLKKGLIVGKERAITKDYVKKLTTSFEKLTPFFGKYRGEKVKGDVARDFSELQRDLRTLGLADGLKSSMERNNLINLLHAIKFMFEYHNAPKKHAEADCGNIKVRLEQLKVEQEELQQKTKITYSQLLKEQQDIEKKLSEVADYWKLITQSSDSFSKMYDVFKFHRSVGGGLLPSHSSHVRVNALKIGEYAFDRPGSLMAKKYEQWSGLRSLYWYL